MFPEIRHVGSIFLNMFQVWSYQLLAKKRCFFSARSFGFRIHRLLKGIVTLSASWRSPSQPWSSGHVGFHHPKKVTKIRRRKPGSWIYMFDTYLIQDFARFDTIIAQVLVDQKKRWFLRCVACAMAMALWRGLKDLGGGIVVGCGILSLLIIHWVMGMLWGPYKWPKING